MIDNENRITISEGADLYNLSRQAIFIAITKGKLKAQKIRGKWRFYQKDWLEYRRQRYDRRFLYRNGRKVYDPENGIISPSMASKIFGVPIQRLYYLIRNHEIPCARSGPSYILDRNYILNNIDWIFVKNKKSKW